MIVRRYAIHEVAQTEEGIAILHSFEFVAVTDSARRAEHLASEHARRHPGTPVILIDRETVASPTAQRLFRSAAGRPAVVEYV